VEFKQLAIKMNSQSCVACKGIMINKAKIPDGILFVCENCNSKRILIENINQLKKANIYGHSYREKLKPQKVSSLLKIFYENISGVNSQYEILDIGCGDGAFIKKLINDGQTVSGLECYSLEVDHLMAEGLNVYSGELGEKIDISKNFNIVTLWDVIEHIDNVEIAMSQLSSLVKKDGKIFILTPDSESIFDLFATLEKRLTLNKSQRVMNICLNRYHLNRFSLTGLEILLKRFGFTLDHSERLQLFSLQENEYMDGFAPGIKRWTNNTSINEFLSRSAITLIKYFNITNKIFVTAIKT